MPIDDPESLAEKVRKARESSIVNPPQKPVKKTDAGGPDADSMGKGMRAGLELVVSIAAGTLLGLWLDKTFDTKPFFLIALFFLGVITGFVNIWRITNDVGYAVGYKNLQDRKDNETAEDTDEKKG